MKALTSYAYQEAQFTIAKAADKIFQEMEKLMKQKDEGDSKEAETNMNHPIRTAVQSNPENRQREALLHQFEEMQRLIRMGDNEEDFDFNLNAISRIMDNVHQLPVEGA